MVNLRRIPAFNNKKSVLFLIAGILILLLAVSFFNSRLRAKSAGIYVDTIQVLKDSIQVQIIANGVLEETNKKEIYTENPSMVGSILVNEGDEVKKGQMMSILESDNYRIELEKARVNLELAELELNKFKDYTLPEIDMAYKKALQDFAHAEKSMLRTKTLYNEGAISENELELEQLRFDEARGTLEKAANSLASSSLDLKSYQSKVALYRLSVSDAENKMEKYGPHIYSPIDGIVTSVNLKEGAFTNPSQPIFVVSDLSVLETRVGISEYDISKIKLDQEVEITTDAMEGNIFQGKIMAISPVARASQVGQTTEAVVQVIIGVVNNSPLLKPGFSIKAKIIADSKNDCIVLPFDSIITEKNGAKVVFVVEDGVARKKEIQTGIESDFTVEVVGGISEGDTVILNPAPSLQEGMKVQTRQEKGNQNDR